CYEDADDLLFREAGAEGPEPSVDIGGTRRAAEEPAVVALDQVGAGLVAGQQAGGHSGARHAVGELAEEQGPNPVVGGPAQNVLVGRVEPGGVRAALVLEVLVRADERGDDALGRQPTLELADPDRQVIRRGRPAQVASVVAANQVGVILATVVEHVGDAAAGGGGPLGERRPEGLAPRPVPRPA